MKRCLLPLALLLGGAAHAQVSPTHATPDETTVSCSCDPRFNDFYS